MEHKRLTRPLRPPPIQPPLVLPREHLTIGLQDGSGECLIAVGEDLMLENPCRHQDTVWQPTPSSTRHLTHLQTPAGDSQWSMPKLFSRARGGAVSTGVR